MSVLIVGDPHLDGSLSLGKQSAGFAFNSRIVDRMTQLEWVYEQAIEHNTTNIVITGDVFDTVKPHHSLISWLIEWLRQCSDYNISVHIIAGNHDISRSGQFITSPLDIISSAEIPQVFVYKQINTIHLDKMGITFLPFRDRRSFNTDSNSEAIAMLKAQLPYEQSSIGDDCLKILIGHLALAGSLPAGNEIDDLVNELHCPLDMFAGYDYVLMGHIHRPQVLSENPYIAHVGSLDISDFGEADHKKHIIIIDPSQNDAIKYVEIPKRSLKSINIQLPDNITNANEYITQFISDIDDLSKSIVKLSIVLPSAAVYNIDRNIIEKQLYKAGVFHVSKISEERNFKSLKKNINEKMQNTVNEFSAIKTYSTLVEENLRTEFISVASSIVQECKEMNKV